MFVQKVAEQSIKDSSLCLFITFSKSNPNRTNLVIFFPFYKPSPDLPPSQVHTPVSAEEENSQGKSHS